MTDLLPIGAFAALTRLSVRMLRYYDERGLLAPAYVDRATGYRYYRIEQAALAEAIRLLRSFDMPLAQVATALDSVGSGDLATLLAEQKDRIETEIDEKRRSLAYLEQLIAHIERGDDFPSAAAELLELAAQQVISRRARRTLNDVGVYTGQTIGMLYAAARAAAATPNGPPFAIYHPVSGAGFAVEVGLPLRCDAAPAPPLSARVLPGGRHAAMTHTGPYETLGAVYRALGGWIWEQGLRPAGPPREVYLTSPGSGLAPDDYRTLLAWPIAGP